MNLDRKSFLRRIGLGAAGLLTTGALEGADETKALPTFSERDPEPFWAAVRGFESCGGVDAMTMGSSKGIGALVAHMVMVAGPARGCQPWWRWLGTWVVCGARGWVWGGALGHVPHVVV